ncbi:MAG: glycerophosphodiester phosphodiesterase family protein [Bacteroidales bacterium]|nr:glycerophosphodiester phosphodiesterase family protein [Bacteroidales bacterium]
MKTRIFLALLLCAVLANAQDRADKIRERLLNRDTNSVIVASHRGDWRNFPENSLEGILNAIKMGADIIEIDLQRTADGELVLMHDATIDRTTTGKGRVEDITLDSIRKVNLRNGLAIRTTQKVPTLREVLVATKGKAMLNLDKADRYFEQVMSILAETGTTHQVVMKGSKSAADVKAFFGKYLNDVIYMPIVNLDHKNAESEILQFVNDMNPVAFELLYKSDSNKLPGKFARELEGKSLIWYNTLWEFMAGGHEDDASLIDVNNGWGYLIDRLQCRIIQTDRPQMLVEYLRGRGLHD